MTILRWEDPPQTRVSWKATAAVLATRPGQWARVCDPTTEGKANTAYRQLRKWGAEAVIRQVDGLGYGVWARVGE